MRKFLVSACYCFALLFFCSAAPAAKADHGYRSSNGGYGGGYRGGYGGGYGGGYSGHDCQGHNSGYAQYQSTIVPVYPGGIYQSYSFGGAPLGGYSNYGQVGFPYPGAAYSAGYGPGSYGPGSYSSGFYGSGYRSTLPRVQLRIGF